MIWQDIAFPRSLLLIHPPVGLLASSSIAA
jgi:hypothetical protein